MKVIGWQSFRQLFGNFLITVWHCFGNRWQLIGNLLACFCIYWYLSGNFLVPFCWGQLVGSLLFFCGNLLLSCFLQVVCNFLTLCRQLFPAMSDNLLTTWWHRFFVCNFNNISELLFLNLFGISVPCFAGAARNLKISDRTELHWTELNWSRPLDSSFSSGGKDIWVAVLVEAWGYLGGNFIWGVKIFGWQF